MLHTLFRKIMVKDTYMRTDLLEGFPIIFVPRLLLQTVVFCDAIVKDYLGLALDYYSKKL